MFRDDPGAAHEFHERRWQGGIPCLSTFHQQVGSLADQFDLALKQLKKRRGAADSCAELIFSHASCLVTNLPSDPSARCFAKLTAAGAVKYREMAHRDRLWRQDRQSILEVLRTKWFLEQRIVTAINHSCTSKVACPPVSVNLLKFC
jgi:hypothetical protein